MAHCRGAPESKLMQDYAAALLIGLATFCAYLLWRIAAAVLATRAALVRVETDLAALKSDLADLASWRPEKLCRFDREK